MASKSRPSDRSTARPTDRPTDRPRVVYSEFGPASEDSTEPAAQIPPQQQNLRVQATRAGRKGKTVTVVTGFQGNAEQLNSLLKQLKTQCGTGGTVKEGTIEIQGDQKQKISEILLKQGYKAKISGG